MKDINTNDYFEDEVNLKELLNILINRKKIIFVITSIFSLFSLIFALFLPNTYTSTALLAPSNPQNSLSSQLSGLSSLAGIAGVNIPGEMPNASTEAIERIKSFEFFSNFFISDIKLENLLAAKKWIPSQNKIVYKKNDFDEKQQEWIRDVKFPKSVIPSNQEAYNYFIKNVLEISEDKNTSFVSVSISHYSPYIAEKWLKIIIKNINESMREEDKQNAQNSILFLQDAANETNLQSLNDAISSLLESQMQTLMLASSNEDYIYKIIDSPIIPEEKSGPNKPLIFILGSILGLILSIFFTLIYHHNKSKHKT